MNPQRRPLEQFRGSSAVPELRIEAWPTIRAEWTALTDCCPEATIYQRDRWLTALSSAYGFELAAATLRDSKGGLAAATLFARGKNPFLRKWTSLPCSDTSPPLALDDEARKQLLTGVAESDFTSGGVVEIRGWRAPEPWQKVDCFALWTLDLARPLNAIMGTMASNFRRQLSRGTEQRYAINVDQGLPALKRFHRLTLETRRRLGLPAQPWRFFKSVFEAFAPSGDLEVWTAGNRGKTVAAMVILRDGPDLHYKWSARAEPTPPGATHRLLAAICEKYAQHCRVMDLGRTDVRNVGLNRFKKETGAKPSPLPYSYVPRVPAQVSSEVLGKHEQMLAKIWRHMPLPIARLLGSILYRYIV